MQIGFGSGNVNTLDLSFAVLTCVFTKFLSPTFVAMIAPGHFRQFYIVLTIVSVSLLRLILSSQRLLDLRSLSLNHLHLSEVTALLSLVVSYCKMLCNGS